MANKFKVGDKVRLIKHGTLDWETLDYTSKNYADLHLNYVYEVIHSDYQCPAPHIKVVELYKPKCDISEWYFYPDHFELVTENFPLYKIDLGEGNVEERSIAVQETLFRYGYFWPRSGYQLFHLYCRYLYTDKDGSLSYGISEDPFSRTKSKEIIYEHTNW